MTENKTKKKARMALWREKNRERIRAYDKKIRERFPNRTREWWLKHPDYRRDKHLRLTYGISLEEFNKLFEQQNSRCACCKTNDPGRKNGWCVDHDHSNGKIRSILCYHCNVILGHVEDDPLHLQMLIDYLKEHKRKNRKMHSYLKTKSVSLELEARYIRKQERRFEEKIRYAKSKGKPFDWYELNRMGQHDHRVGIVRQEARATHIARAFLMGYAYKDIEAIVYERPDWLKIKDMVAKYAERDNPRWNRPVMEMFKEWMEDAITHFKSVPPRKKRGPIDQAERIRRGQERKARYLHS